MIKYILKFKYAHENRYLYMALDSNILEQAIIEAQHAIDYLQDRHFGDKQQYVIEKAIIEKHIKQIEIVWEK